MSFVIQHCCISRSPLLLIHGEKSILIRLMCNIWQTTGTNKARWAPFELLSKRQKLRVVPPFRAVYSRRSGKLPERSPAARWVCVCWVCVRAGW